MICYLHGFASSGVSGKVDKLRERFGNDQVIAPDLPFDPNEVYTLVNAIVREKYFNNPPTTGRLIFVGTSLGAFYANYFGHLFDCPAVLANPSVCPSQTLQDRLGPNKSYMSGEEFLVSIAHLNTLESMRDYITQNYASNLINLFLAKDDEVIPYQAALDEFKFVNSVCVTEDGGHRYNKNWNLVVDKIEELLKN